MPSPGKDPTGVEPGASKRERAKRRARARELERFINDAIRRAEEDGFTVAPVVAPAEVRSLFPLALRVWVQL